MTKRKRYSHAFKVRVAQEAICEELMLAALWKRHGMHLIPAGACLQSPRGNQKIAAGIGKDDGGMAKEVASGCAVSCN
jgi:hypothetical protein